MTRHEVEVFRSLVTGKFKAVCTCGWVCFGEQEHVQKRAATHDLEWTAIDDANKQEARQQEMTADAAEMDAELNAKGVS